MLTNLKSTLDDLEASHSAILARYLDAYAGDHDAYAPSLAVNVWRQIRKGDPVPATERLVSDIEKYLYVVNAVENDAQRAHVSATAASLTGYESERGRRTWTRRDTPGVDAEHLHDVWFENPPGSRAPSWLHVVKFVACCAVLVAHVFFWIWMDVERCPTLWVTKEMCDPRHFRSTYPSATFVYIAKALFPLLTLICGELAVVWWPARARQVFVSCGWLSLGYVYVVVWWTGIITAVSVLFSCSDAGASAWCPVTSPTGSVASGIVFVIVSIVGFFLVSSVAMSRVADTWARTMRCRHAVWKSRASV